MTFKLSQKSLNKLEGVHEDLQKVVHKAIALTKVDFGVTCGLRTVEEQKALYAQGRTKPGKIVTWTMNSRHLTGKAVDLVAYKDGKVSWDEKLYKDIAAAMLEAAEMLNVKLVWGGSWDKPDYPHHELDRKVYG